MTTSSYGWELQNCFVPNWAVGAIATAGNLESEITLQMQLIEFTAIWISAPK